MYAMRKHVLGVSSHALRTGGESSIPPCLGKPRLAPSAPLLLLLKTSVFGTAAVVKCINDGLRERFVSRRVPNRLCA